LTEAAAGAKYRIVSAYARDRKSLEFLDQEGIHPDVCVQVDTRNCDGTISLSVDKQQIRLGTSAPERIWAATS
jgi:hypothetical protein